jgi:hypothetical protein
MTLDERIRSNLKAAAAAVPSATPGDPNEIRNRGIRRRWARRAGWSLATGIVVLGTVALALPYDPNAIDPATTHDVESVEIADLAVAVTDSEPVSTGPDVWLGLPGPSPEFDTSPLGPDLSFAPGEPMPGDLNDRLSRAVYLGDQDGEPFYIYSTPAPSIWDRIFEVTHGNFSGDALGTSHTCCSGGDMDHEEGLPGLSFMQTTGEPDLIVAEWLGLSPAVSVVAYEVDGVALGWQTPVGGVSSIRLDDVPAEVAFVAYDSLGREVNRFEPGPMNREPSGSEDILPEDAPGAEWAPLTSEGIEIGTGDLSDEELRDTIEPLPTDRLFRVTVEDGDLIVRVREGMAHVFARSCAFVDSVDLPPGWPTTCLE